MFEERRFVLLLELFDIFSEYQYVMNVKPLPAIGFAAQRSLEEK